MFSYIAQKSSQRKIIKYKHVFLQIFMSSSFIKEKKKAEKFKQPLQIYNRKFLSPHISFHLELFCSCFFLFVFVFSFFDRQNRQISVYISEMSILTTLYHSDCCPHLKLRNSHFGVCTLRPSETKISPTQ